MNSIEHIPAHIEQVSAETLVEQKKASPEWQALNRWEQAAARLPQQLCPLDHVFTPHLYTRIIFMAAGSELTSKIHLFEHPYIIAAGVVEVWTLEAGWVTLRAPHVGVTKPATRRKLRIIEDTIWITSHVTDDTDPERIIAAITYDHMKLGHMDSVPEECLAEIRENQKGVRP